MLKFGRFLLWFLHPLAWLLFPFKALGRENIPPAGAEPPVIFCANHVSIIDPVFLEMCQKRHIFFMAKAELFDSWFGRNILGKALGAFPVKRGAGDTGAIDTAEEIVRSGRVLGIFPEGTRSKDGALGRPKSGAALIAAQTGASVVPVCITMKEQHLRLFRRTKILFGKPMSPAELHLDDPQKPDLRYASRQIMERIRQMLETQQPV